MRSVFDQQGEGWLPGTPQANQAQSATQKTPLRNEQRYNNWLKEFKRVVQPPANVSEESLMRNYADYLFRTAHNSQSSNGKKELMAELKQIAAQGNNEGAEFGVRKLGYHLKEISQKKASKNASPKTPATQQPSIPRQNALPPAGSRISGKPGAVADGKGGFSYPGGPQTANVNRSATQPAPRTVPAPQQSAPAQQPARMPQSAAQPVTAPGHTAPTPQTTTKPSNVPIGFGTPNSSKPLHGETLESRLAWAERQQRMNIAGYSTSSILKDPAIFNKLFNEKKLTPEQAGFLSREAYYLHTRFGHRAFGNNMTPRNNHASPQPTNKTSPPISRISTPAPQPQSTTQSQDPGFLNLPAPRVSTPAPSSSSGLQFRNINGEVKIVGNTATTPQSGNKSVFDQQGEGWLPGSPEGQKVLKGMR